MKKIRVGIIGTGGMANGHAGEFKKHTGVELTSCFDVDTAKAKDYAERHGIRKVAPDASALLNDVDAVSIVTTDKFHAEYTLLALAAGKNVLCEKPLTVTLAEARKVAAAARKASESGLINMINFSYRSSAAFQEAMKLVSKGALGEIRHVQSSYMQSWLVGEAWTKDQLLWRLCTARGSGGVLGDLGCHILDLTSACSEDLKQVRCNFRTFPKMLDGKLVTEYEGQKLDANDTAIIEFELKGGGIGVCQTSRWATGQGNHLRLEVSGTEGALMFDLDRSYTSIDLCNTKKGGSSFNMGSWTTKELKPTPNVWARFIKSIKSGVQDQPDLLRGAEVQAYLDACERSSKSGKWELSWSIELHGVK